MLSDARDFSVRWKAQFSSKTPSRRRRSRLSTRFVCACALARPPCAPERCGFTSFFLQDALSRQIAVFDFKGSVRITAASVLISGMGALGMVTPAPANLVECL